MLKPLFKHLAHQIFSPSTLLHHKYKAFRDVLLYDTRALDCIADLEEIHYQEQYADWVRIAWLCERVSASTLDMIRAFQEMSLTGSRGLLERHAEIRTALLAELVFPSPSLAPPYVLALDDTAIHASLTGGKASTLAHLAPFSSIPLLPGCVVTANAFNLFLEHNGLRKKIDRCLRAVRPCSTRRMQRLASFMVGEIMAGEVPPVVAEALTGAAERLGKISGSGLLILRSSAVAEDSDISFAGQYLSVADVNLPEILHVYKRILAGKYSAKALFYRIFHGLSDGETSMAVLIQPMLHPTVSGVVYTRDPGQDGDVLGIYAVQGSGDALMDGGIRAHASFITRDRDAFSLPVPENPLVNETLARRLFRICLELEKIQGGPQDVEWVLCADDALVIVQTRALDPSRVSRNGWVSPDLVSPDLVSPDLVSPDPVVPDSINLKRLPLSVYCAASGRASGPVHVLTDWNDLEGVPDQCIVLVPGLSSELVQIIPRLRGVLARTGSRASHFASVARECGIPVLISPDMDTVVRPSMMVTMEGVHAALYEGELVPGGRDATPARQMHAPGEKRLARIMSHVARLTLTDPESSGFAVPNCRSMHDLVRFVHEKSVGEMFTLVNTRGRGLARARKLVSDLPLSMYVLDLQNGVSRGASGSTVTPGDFTCVPLKALWRGLSSPDIHWDPRMPHLDWEEFDRISAGIFSSDTPLLSSYAVISRRYMHLMLRFGYHFSVVDCFCGDESKNNYINFRFKGGGAGFDGRILRLEFITRILQADGFQLTTKGDMLDARLTHLESSDIRKSLHILGRILAMTRLMDMRLRTPGEVDGMVEEFYRR